MLHVGSVWMDVLALPVGAALVSDRIEDGVPVSNIYVQASSIF